MSNEKDYSFESSCVYFYAKNYHISPAYQLLNLNQNKKANDLPLLDEIIGNLPKKEELVTGIIKHNLSKLSDEKAKAFLNYYNSLVKFFKETDEKAQASCNNFNNWSVFNQNHPEDYGSYLKLEGHDTDDKQSYKGLKLPLAQYDILMSSSKGKEKLASMVSRTLFEQCSDGDRTGSSGIAMTDYGFTVDEVFDLLTVDGLLYPYRDLTKQPPIPSGLSQDEQKIAQTLKSLVLCGSRHEIKLEQVKDNKLPAYEIESDDEELTATTTFSSKVTTGKGK